MITLLDATGNEFVVAVAGGGGGAQLDACVSTLTLFV